MSFLNILKSSFNKETLITSAKNSIRTFLAGTQKLCSTFFPGYVNGLIITGKQFRPVVLAIATFFGFILGKNSFLYRLTSDEKIKRISDNAGLAWVVGNTATSLVMGSAYLLSMLFRSMNDQDNANMINGNLTKLSWGIAPAACTIAIFMAIKRYKAKSIDADKSYLNLSEHRILKALSKACLQTGRSLGICMYATQLNDERVDPGYIAGYTIAGPVAFLTFFILYLGLKKTKPLEHCINGVLGGGHLAITGLSYYSTAQLGMSYGAYDDKIPFEASISMLATGIAFIPAYLFALWPEVKKEVKEDKERRARELATRKEAQLIKDGRALENGERNQEMKQIPVAAKTISLISPYHFSPKSDTGSASSYLAHPSNSRSSQFWTSQDNPLPTTHTSEGTSPDFAIAI